MFKFLSQQIPDDYVRLRTVKLSPHAEDIVYIMGGVLLFILACFMSMSPHTVMNRKQSYMWSFLLRLLVNRTRNPPPQRLAYVAAVFVV